jgi:hypothetical protein
VACDPIVFEQKKGDQESDEHSDEGQRNQQGTRSLHRGAAQMLGMLEVDLL